MGFLIDGHGPNYLSITLSTGQTLSRVWGLLPAQAVPFLPPVYRELVISEWGLVVEFSVQLLDPLFNRGVGFFRCRVPWRDYSPPPSRRDL